MELGLPLEQRYFHMVTRVLFSKWLVLPLGPLLPFPPCA